MLSWETIVEVHALRKQGWSIAAIARHVGATRLTVRRYLSGERTPGQRVRTVADPFEEFAGYCRLRLAADAHLWCGVPIPSQGLRHTDGGGVPAGWPGRIPVGSTW